MARVVQNERIPCPGTRPQPSKPINDIGTGGEKAGVLLVVCEDTHLVEAVVLREEPLDVVHVIDTTAQFAPLSKIIDSDKKNPSLSRDLANRLSGFLRFSGGIFLKVLVDRTLDLFRYRASVLLAILIMA